MQRSELHKELGADMFKSWTQDHAQEVLSSERYELWSKEEEKAEEALKQLKIGVVTHPGRISPVCQVG